MPYTTPSQLQLFALDQFPMVQSGDDLLQMIGDAVVDNGHDLLNNDILVIAQKIVSKAEGQLIALDQVTPSEEAIQRARETEKDPRLVELILRESTTVVRQERNLIITENHLGIVMANAGIDQSNVDDGCALLLPEDPDRTANQVREEIKRRFDVGVGVVIADSIGRAWRCGIVGHAIGVAGIEAVIDLRESHDLYGRDLRVTEIAVADEIAAAGTLLMGQGDEGKPVVLVRGFNSFDRSSDAKSLVRPKDKDLFR